MPLLAPHSPSIDTQRHENENDIDVIRTSQALSPRHISVAKLRVACVPALVRHFTNTCPVNATDTVTFVSREHHQHTELYIADWVFGSEPTGLMTKHKLYPSSGTSVKQPATGLSRHRIEIECQIPHFGSAAMAFPH
jgi:hypothetical protein